MPNAARALTRRNKERLQRVVLIIDAAERLFLDKGFSATTMNEIGDAAEFSRATLYHYFPSKESIYVAILERGMDELAAEAVFSLEAIQGAVAKIEKIKDVLVSFFRQKQNFFRLYFITRSEAMPYLGDELSERLERKTKELDEVFHEVYRDGMAAGELRPADPVAMGDIFFAQIIGLMLLDTTEKLEPPLIDNVNQATAFFVENIRKK